MTHRIRAVFLCLLITTSAHANSADRERAKVRDMRDQVLKRLYQEQPGARADIGNAPGYAVFSNVGVNLLFFSAAGGNGVAKNNRTGQEVFMNMAAAGLGLGLGIKDFRGVFIFHTDEAYRRFIHQGWDFSGQADAAAKSTGGGNGGGVAVSAIPDVSIYQLTETGLSLQATLQGTKYWISRKLNEYN